jgi:hypothetical protein
LGNISKAGISSMERDNEDEWWSTVDPLLIERPARLRCVQLRELLLARKIPSFPVKTEDLANVVKGYVSILLLPMLPG